MNIRKLTALGALALAVAIGSSAHAGIKYWDNPAYRAFDVDCYVSGAVWNFDGIRNDGADQPHSTTATTWKNLGSSGSNNDMFVRLLNQAGNGWYNGASTTDPLANLGTINGRGTGSWTENGFTFTGDSELRSKGSIDSGTSYTIQMLVAGSFSEQVYSKPYLMAVQQTHFAFYGDSENSRLYWGISNTTGYHPFISGDELGYMTAILNGTDNTATFFSGTTIPTSGDGFRQFTVSGKTDSGYCICGFTGYNGQFKGTMHSYRYYKRVLTEEELAWNRFLDERRFFDRAAPLPVTNAVVVSSVAASAEPAGTYAVDGHHVFTAPRLATVGNAKYICTGYTLETWDNEAGDWGAPVSHARELSCKVEEADRVRITWQWMDGEGIATYDVSDYVWTGLEVFYDGICNVGTNQPHSYSATNWVNLGSVGSKNDVFVQRLNAAGSGWETATDLNPVGGRDPGCWAESGFVLKGASRFRCNAPGGFSVGKDYSLQMLADAKASDQGTDSYAYLLGANNDKFAFRIDNSNGKLYWRYENNGQNQPLLSGGAYDYMTANMKEDNKQTFFSGTTEPTSGNGYKANTSYAYSDTGFCLGGYGKNDRGNLLVGTLKNFRQYDHALSAADLAQNRKVDNWRYFGIHDVTNVIVQSTVPYLHGNEPDGGYEVDGSHTFTAPGSVTAKGIDYACDGYIVEVWDGSAWTNATPYESTSYTYTSGTSPERVRLTWKWRATHGLRTADDYSFDDYSQAGLLWNYDGIRNQGGTDADHDSTAATWKNLGSGGAAYDLHWNGATPAGGWTTNGYRFAGGPRFKGDGKIGPLKNFTLQTLIDADIASQTASSSQFSYLMNAYDNHFNLSLISPSYDGSAESSFCWKAQGGTFMYFHAKDNKYGFATAIMDYDAKKAMMFPDTTIPTEYNKDGTYGAQRLYHEFGSVSSVSTTGYGLGNRNNNGTEGLVGTIKSFRYYDRVLTEEEIVRNRNVDAVRYFGELGVTNLVVEVAKGETYACDPAPGAYFVEGSWTFTAAPTSGGRQPAGCRVQDWDPENERWTNTRSVEALSYTYDASSGVKQRITWRSLRPLLFIVR